jgi:DNA-binding NarL/FixJ family response regulator
VTVTKAGVSWRSETARPLNGQGIAKELVVSERTVENHVANILKKLELHSRDQVAPRIAKQ